MVMRHALVLSVAGVAAGLLGALALSRAVAGLLFNLSPNDPATLAGVAALLTAVALLASYWPARRATRVDPLVALRSE
jgi:ABC-type antimicrobial peptide transport system permease subunit